MHHTGFPYTGNICEMFVLYKSCSLYFVDVNADDNADYLTLNTVMTAIGCVPSFEDKTW